MNHNSYEIRNLLIVGLEAVITDIPIWPSDFRQAKPKYPYATVGVLVAVVPQFGHDVITNSLVESTDPNFTNDIIETYSQTPEMTLSVNAYGDSEESAAQLVYRLYDWFSVGGELYLDNFDFDIIEVMDVNDRDVVIQDDWERRLGFDVRLRYTRDIERRMQTIENNETRRNE